MPETNTAPQQQQPAPQAPKQPVRIEGTKPTAPTNLYEGSPRDRWQADQDARTTNDPWLDPNKVLTRDATGNIVAHEKKIGADGEATIGPALEQHEGDQQTGEQGTRPAPADGDDQRIKVGDVDYSAAELREAVAHMAETKLQKAHVPETPAGYKIELPKDLILPNGAQFQVANVNDPVKGPGLRAAMEWAHSKGMSQSDFSEMLGVYAAATSGEQIMIANAAKRERDAMGVTGPARVDAILQYVKAHYPAALKPVAATLATRAQVEMFEDIIIRRTNGGGGSLSQRGRDVESTTISDEAWGKMSYHQQVEYAREATARAAQGVRR